MPRATNNLLSPPQFDQATIETVRSKVGSGTTRQEAMKGFTERQKPPLYKGALVAMAADGQIIDQLIFRFFPESVEIKTGAALAEEEIPGRAFPALQDTGGLGVKISLDLLFYDVCFGPGVVTSTAAEAEQWVYRNANKNTRDRGRAAPAPDVWLVLGSPNDYQFTNGAVRRLTEVAGRMPIRVAIGAVSMSLGFFDRASQPQSNKISIELTQYEPIELVSAFKPRGSAELNRSAKTKKGGPAKMDPRSARAWEQVLRFSRYAAYAQAVPILTGIGPAGVPILGPEKVLDIPAFVPLGRNF